MPLDSTTFVEEPTVVTDLRAGRDYLERHGWCQGQSRHGEQVCLFGGILAVTGGQRSGMVAGSDLRRTAAIEALQAALDAKLGYFKSAAQWQDEPGRAIGDVLAVYDLAIERANPDG